MSHAIWTALAEDDLEEIAYWIAVEDGRPMTARKIVEEIRERADKFAAAPNISQRHPDLPDDWFYFRHKRWIVVYREKGNGMDVLRVVDCARDFKRLFS